MAAPGSAVDVLNVLLAAVGSNFDAEDVQRRRPLHYAAVADDLPAMEALRLTSVSLDSRAGGSKTRHALTECWLTKPFVAQRLVGG